MYYITLQHASTAAHLPSDAQFKKWVKSALKSKIPSAELTLRIVNPDEMLSLNSHYRHKHKTTNVLSFPFETPLVYSRKVRILGDIVICAAVIETEANEQNKSLHAHWAHMIVHGVLHLLGYDHEKEADATLMEAEEIRILNNLGFANPY